MLPNFLVIGAHKAGTTTLFQHLRHHPDVFLPADKEVHFFSEHNWARGLAWYESVFDPAGDARAVGEVSPGYSSYPMFDDVPERAVRVLPDARLVYVVREPIARLLSHYRQDVHSWAEKRPIDQALLDWRMYVSRSMYALQIQRWLDQGYAREQLLVVTTDDLQDRCVETVARVFTFLDVDATFRPPTLGATFNQGDRLRKDRPATARLRSSPAYRHARSLAPAALRGWLWHRWGSAPVDPNLTRLSIRPETRAALLDHLRPDLRALRTHLGADFHCWGLLDDEAAAVGS